MKIAVVGGGVAGIVAAWHLSQVHEVTLFEATARLGGHTNTITIKNGGDAGLAVDTGFIVLNDKTYPNLHHFLHTLQVPVRYADMSFAYYDPKENFAYAGTDANGIFCHRRNIVSPSFYSFLLEISQFSQKASELLARGALRGMIVKELIATLQLSPALQRQYLLPMAGAIWSASDAGILEFPAETLVGFFLNHGLLSLKNRPRWQTVVGGSNRYITRFSELFGGEIHLNTPIKKIVRSNTGATVITAQGMTQLFDAVVIATHGDQALQLLEDPTPEERETLGAWEYSSNHTVLHTDRSWLHPKRRAWASWNYVRHPESDNRKSVAVTYHMNRLQGLQTETDYFVTLNPHREIPQASIIYQTTYHHPVYTLAALRSQQQLQSLQGKRHTYFCGSYFGYGFHEDAVTAGLRVAQLLGGER